MDGPLRAHTWGIERKLTLLLTYSEELKLFIPLETLTEAPSEDIADHT